MRYLAAAAVAAGVVRLWEVELALVFKWSGACELDQSSTWLHTFPADSKTCGTVTQSKKRRVKT